MFKRRDIPPVLLLLFLITLVMITLSQILVVHHHGRYSKNTRNARQLQRELRQVDKTIQIALSSDSSVPSVAKNKIILKNEIYARRIAAIIRNSYRSVNPEYSTNGRTRHTSAFIDEDSDSPEHRLVSGNVGASDETMPRRGDVAGSENSPLGTAEGGIGLRPNNRTNPLTVNKTLRNTEMRLPLCPSVPRQISGKVFVDFNHTHNMTITDVIRDHPDVIHNGIWRPPKCIARHRVAIIIPYRDRLQHLTTLLSHVLPILKRQQLDFRIYVVEQHGNDTFNKGRIMNAAYREAIKEYDFQCFVFHDVDLIPEDDRNMYSCPSQPRHMSVAIDEMEYRLAYELLVGGVLNMRTDHFQIVNGYSNLYWGWGAEDDDMAYRILHLGLKIIRPPSNVGRYKMIKHTKRTPTDWRKRARLLQTGTKRVHADGLNSVQYTVISKEDKRLYTHITVDIGRSPYH